MSPKRAPAGPAFRVEARQLAPAAAGIAKRIPARPVIPIIGGIHLTVGDGQLAITTFDYEVASVATVEVLDGAAGTALVSGRLFAELVKTFPDKPVDISTTGTQLTMRCGAITVSLPLMPVEDYPTLPKTPPVIGSVDGKDFAAAVARVAPAASRDGTLVSLTGIHLAFSTDEIQLASSNRYRGAIATVPWSMEAAGQLSALVPADVLTDTAKAMANSEVINIGVDDGLIGLAGDGLYTSSRLLADDGVHANLSKVFPPASPHPARVNIAELSNAVRRARLVAADKTPCRLAFDDGQLTVAATGLADERIGEVTGCQYAGRTVTVGINPDYLLDALSCIGGQDAEISISTSIKPVLFVAPDDPTYRHLVVPIRMGGNPE